MAKLTEAQLLKYKEDVVRGIAEDIALEKFGSSTAKALRVQNLINVIDFILDHQDG